MMKKIKFTASGFSLSAFLCLFSFSVARAAGLPSWYNLNAHVKLVESKAKGESAAGKFELQKFQSKKMKLGSHQLQLVDARFGANKNQSDNDYILSEIFSDPPESAKPLFQLVDKGACDSKAVEDVSVKKLGFVADIGIYFLQIKLVSPHCTNSEILSPKIFMVVQEKKKSIEKIYESAIANDGKYTVKFENELIRLQYTKGSDSKSSNVDLTWDEKSQSFTEQP